MSKFIPMKRGIPQGTVLGPLLFSLFTNDLCAAHPTRTRVVKYADDQTWSHVIHQGDNDLSSDEMSHIISWCTDNYMVLNVSKTKELILSNHKRAITLPHSAC